jgi:hypothetical protein
MNNLVNVYFKSEGSAYEALKQLVDVLGAEVVIEAVADIEDRRRRTEPINQLVMQALMGDNDGNG